MNAGHGYDTTHTCRDDKFLRQGDDDMHVYVHTPI